MILIILESFSDCLLSCRKLTNAVHKRIELLPLSQNPKSKQLIFKLAKNILTWFHHGRCI